MLAEASKLDTPMPRRIQTRRAVALMRLRMDGTKQNDALQQLQEVTKLALHYYGPHAELVRDMNDELAAYLSR